MGFLENFKNKLAQKQLELYDKRQARKKLWEERYEELKSSEPLPKSDYVDQRKAATERIRAGKSRIAAIISKVNLFLAFGVGFALLYYDIPPAKNIVKFFKGLDVHSWMIHYFATAISLYVGLAIIGAILVSILERRYGKTE